MQYVYMNTNTTIAQAPAATQEAPASSIVRLQGVSKIYGSGDAQVRALDDVSVGSVPANHRHHGSSAPASPR